MLMEDMDKLMYLGASRENAAELVADRLKRSDWNKSAWEIGDLSADTLADKHARADRIRFDDGIASLEGLRDNERIVSYLSNFSKALLPKKLKKLVSNP